MARGEMLSARKWDGVPRESGYSVQLLRPRYRTTIQSGGAGMKDGMLGQEQGLHRSRPRQEG